LKPKALKRVIGQRTATFNAGDLLVAGLVMLHLAQSIFP
jgi:hypothetical protein